MAQRVHCVADVEACAQQQPWSAAYAAAVAAGTTTYTDPTTGYSVFTALGLLQQQSCCGNKCRHCPYGHLHCAAEQRQLLPTQPVLLRATPRARGRGSSAATVRRSYTRAFAWHAALDISRAHAPDAVLVLPFIATTGMLVDVNAHGPDGTSQQVHLHAVFDALKACGQDAVAVPVTDGLDAADNAAVVDTALQALGLGQGLLN